MAHTRDSAALAEQPADDLHSPADVPEGDAALISCGAVA